MPRIPSVSGRQVVAAFQRAGFEIRGQRGSHIVLKKAGLDSTLSIPNHRRVAQGTLRTEIRKAGLTVEEFIELLR